MAQLEITLEAARVNAGMTQQYVADTLNVRRETIGNWEKNPGQMSAAMFERLCSLYKVPMDAISLS